MAASITAALIKDDIAVRSRDADKYTVEKHWSIHVFPLSDFTVFQPYIKGYSGEYMQKEYGYYARFWIDKELKKSMGQ